MIWHRARASLIPLLALVATSFFGASASAQQVTINFDELPSVHGAPIPLDQYLGQGVVFTSASDGTAFVWSAGGGSVFTSPSGGTSSPPNAIKGATGAARVSILATFVHPETGEPATTSKVSVYACSGPGPDLLSSNVALVGYDKSGNPVVADYPEPGVQYEQLTIEAAGIHRVLMVAGDHLDNYDDFTFEGIAAFVPVSIDIKPGSYPNSINIGSSGVIPVAVLSTNSFDATEIDPSTVSLAGATIKLVGKGTLLSHREDINGDGLIDFVCQVLTEEFLVEPGETTAVLEALTVDGVAIRGEDSVRIVPE
jgi:hypothetical protein